MRMANEALAPADLKAASQCGNNSDQEALAASPGFTRSRSSFEGLK